MPASKSNVPLLVFLLVTLTANASADEVVDRKVTREDMPRIPHTEPEQALATFKLASGFQLEMVASEPMVSDPVDACFDEFGRMFVAEMHGYPFSQEPTKLNPNGGGKVDAGIIRMLEDTDGDGQVDESKVFYQGRDIDSPHGVCVLGNKVIVSAGENVIVFTDKDGDDKPDDKQIMFTGLSGTQHDHGIHKFMFGPDGKLYFNFGNEGKQLKDPKTGKHVVDVAGNEIRESMKPYQQGMVFRCNLDGTEVETLGWNFRNNWMITVDSFGTLWQSDNDDDGNTGVRINYVMEYGNYGYRDAFTGAGWRAPRTGMHSQRALRHWHQNDPGIVPNLINTGAGSPTGILIYEGDLLPKVFQNQMIHCDAGPSVVRAYPVKNSGAGYRGEIVNLLEGTRDRWFRPSDVQAAPDGSLIVADWYDPGVGGHAMGDLDRGRLFRVLPKDHSGKYEIPKFDYSTVDGAIAALGNANNSVRYHAWTALNAMGAKAEETLQAPWRSDNSRLRARALWLLGKIPNRGQHYVDLAIKDDNPDIRITGLRLARQLSSVNNIATIEKLVSDSSPQVRRECAIALRYETDDLKPQLWAKLALQHDGDDRWYLEALGIGAELDWDNCLAAWRSLAGSEFRSTKSGRDIVWRSRAEESPLLIASLINDKATPVHELPRYFRAFDFLTGNRKNEAIGKIAFATASDDKTRQELIAREAFNRLEGDSVKNDEQRAALNRALDASVGTEHFVSLVTRFGVTDRYETLLKLAQAKPSDPSGIAAIRALLDKNQTTLIVNALQTTDESAQNTILALGNSTNNKASKILSTIVFDTDADLEMRRQSVRARVRGRAGAIELLKEVESKKLDERLSEAAAMAFGSAPFGDIRSKAEKLFPARQTKGAESLPPIRELVRMTGNATNGMAIFAKTGTCANCHVVNGKGKEVGPDLSQIGSKLSREAMFESIIYPSAGIAHNYENFSAVLDDGNVVVGLVTSRTDSQLTMKDAEGIQRTIKTENIEELVKQPISLMPNDVSKLMTMQELIDVVEYMGTLKK